MLERKRPPGHRKEENAGEKEEEITQLEAVILAPCPSWRTRSAIPRAVRQNVARCTVAVLFRDFLGFWDFLLFLPFVTHRLRGFLRRGD